MQKSRSNLRYKFFTIWGGICTPVFISAFLSDRMQLVQAQYAEFRKHAESVVFDFESKLEISAQKIESLEKHIAISDDSAKQILESTEAKLCALESEKQLMQNHLDERIRQVD